VHPALHLDGVARRVDDAGKFDQHPVAGGLYDAAAMLSDFRVDQLTAMRFEAIERAFLVRAHQSRVGGHIGGEDRGKTALDGLLHGPPVAPTIAQRKSGRDSDMPPPHPSPILSANLRVGRPYQNREQPR